MWQRHSCHSCTTAGAGTLEPMGIHPHPTKRILAELPPKKIPVHVRVCCFLFKRLIRNWRHSLLQRRESRTESLLTAAKNCLTRPELERLLGAPQVVVVGTGCRLQEVDSTAVVPDTVEYYLHKGVRVAIWFKDNEIIAIFGWADLTPWDVLCGLRGRPFFGNSRIASPRDDDRARGSAVRE